MFGYTEAELEKAQRNAKGRWWFRLRVLLELTLLLVVSVVSAALHALTHPELIEQGLDQLTAGMPIDVRLAGLELDANFDPFDRDTWRVVLVGVRIEPHDPKAPMVTAHRLTVDLPRLAETVQTKELAFGESRVIGLHIHARMQRPPPPWEATETAISMLRSKHLEAWNARYTAEPDPPLLANDVHSIYGDLYDVTFVPGERLLSGHAGLEAPDLEIGGIRLDRVKLPHVRATDSNLIFEDGALRYGQGHATVHGRVEELFRNPAVRLQVRIRRASLANVIATSTGEASPLAGSLDMDMLVVSGGVLPRGEALISGKASVKDGRLRLGDKLPPALRTLIRYAPFMELDEYDDLKLSDMEGRLSMNRNGTTVEELLYHSQPNDLQLFGDIYESGFRLVLRVVPLKYAHLRPGMGVVLTSNEEAFIAELATREDLLPNVWGEESELDPTEVKQRLRDARKADRQQRRAERQALREEKRQQRLAEREAQREAENQAREAREALAHQTEVPPEP